MAYASVGKGESMIEKIKLGFEVDIEYDEEEKAYQVSYIYDGEWRGTPYDEAKPVSKEKAISISEKIIEILQEELSK